MRSALREVVQVLSAKLVAGRDRATFPAHGGREDVFVPSTHCSAGEKSAASLLPHDDVRLAARKTAVEDRANLSRAAATERAGRHHLLTRKTNIPCCPQRILIDGGLVRSVRPRISAASRATVPGHAGERPPFFTYIDL